MLRQNTVRPYFHNVADLGIGSLLTDAVHEGTVIDGEIVALDAEGRPSFNALQNADIRTPVDFYAFDILMNRGEDTKKLPLRDRLSILDSAFVPSDHAHLCDNFPGPSQKIVVAVKKIGGEGVIAKRLAPGVRTIDSRVLFHSITALTGCADEAVNWSSLWVMAKVLAGSCRGIKD